MQELNQFNRNYAYKSLARCKLSKSTYRVVLWLLF